MRALGAATRAAGAALIVIGSLLAGYGWLYVLRGADWLGAGPQVGDSLPLLQLAGSDRQPVVRVVLAWLLAGAIAGTGLVKVSPPRRALLAGTLAVVLLLVASQLADALTRNLNLGDVILHRRPGLGPVLEGVAFAVGCWLPRRVAGVHRWRRRHPVVGGLDRV